VHIHIPIPIGAKRVAIIGGAVWKLVSCTNCRQRFAYLMELQARGEDHDLLFLDGQASGQRARAQAERNLLQKSRNCLLAVPCPHCGFYQEDMSRRLKEEASINRFQIIGAILAMLSFAPLVFDVPYLWGITVVLAAAGVSLLVYGYVLAHRFNPNAGDPEPRKALGQKWSVWGERLDELLATNPDPEECGSAGPADGQKENCS
jgi:hypothetical protein